MKQTDIQQALRELARDLRGPLELIIGGAGALIMLGEIPRATTDCDVLYASPDLHQVAQSIRQVAERLGLSPGWLNGSIQAYLDVLPPDFRNRLVSIPSEGRLSVLVLQRRDIMVMKLFAGRPRDIQDIVSMQPNASEWNFVMEQLPRIGRIDAARAERMKELVNDLSRGPT